MRTACVLFACFGLMLPGHGQKIAAPLPPSEELKTATAPFDAARAQPNDLTEADLLALSVGMQRARQSCEALAATAEKLGEQPAELLALARLCMFGQQFEQAREQAVRYLELPQPPEREAALLLLSQAFLGLKDPVNATERVMTLLKEYPYDAQIHYAADQVIVAGALQNDFQNGLTLKLCAEQLKTTLPLLEGGKALPGKEGSASAATLFADAVRCRDIAGALHDVSAANTRKQLAAILQVPAWQGTAELAPMQSAWKRAEMIGQSTPLPMLRGQIVRASGPLLVHTLDLTHGTELLVPFTLWVPGTAAAIRDFPPTAPLQKIYLLTSWSSNTGGPDAPTPEVLAALRGLAAGLPKQAAVLVVPDAALQQLSADVYPGAIVVRDGIVETKIPLSGNAGKRMAVLALGPVQSAASKGRSLHGNKRRP